MTRRFAGELTVTQLSGTPEAWRFWRLNDALTFEQGGRQITVPPGFVSDGPSIPRVFWTVMPVWGTYGRAAIVHDYLCTRLALNHPHPEATSRRVADRLFFQAMKALGVGRITRMLLYFGARLDAWFGTPTILDFNRDLLIKQIVGTK